MPDSRIELLVSQATQFICKLLEEAYEIGRFKEREELTIFLSRGNEAQPIIAQSAVDRNGRAPSGTVKPAIKELIEKAPNGIRASDIIERTGFKDNSVRGTLSALRAEGFAERHGEVWVLKRKGSLGGTSEPS